MQALALCSLLVVVGCTDRPLERSLVMQDLSVRHEDDLARSADLSQPHDLAHGPADLSVPIDLSVSLDLAAPHDLTTLPDLSTCTEVYGNWLYTQTQVGESGCALNVCGYPGYMACGEQSLDVATEESPGQVRWMLNSVGLLGDWIGALDTNGHFNTTNAYFPSSHFIGDIDASCHLKGTITWLPGGSCSAVLEYTGVPF